MINRRTIKHLLLGGLAALMTCAAGAGPAQARERIVNFASDVTVHRDASLSVRETITVISERRDIRRGIYRDFPTRYRTKRGARVTVGFKVMGVTRNGAREPFVTERLTNGVRVRIGNKNRLIRPGRHTYVIHYRTTRQLGFFETFDELYWNVTGTGWKFEIAKATARIHLPQGAVIANHAGYTGPLGATGKDFRFRPLDDESAFFETTRPLAPGEGLTVAVSWPKGFVTPPGDGERLAWFLKDNSILLAGLLGLGMVLIYFIPVWMMVGRDPDGGTIVPLYAPPKGFSPAAARYVSRMGYDDKTFTAAIVSMAVKGYLTIEEKSDGSYRLEITEGEHQPLSMGERAVARKLFAFGRKGIDLKQSNHKSIGGAQKALRTWLRSEYEKVYFLRNLVYFVPGAGLSVLAMGAIVAASDQVEIAAFLALWLAGWSVGVYFLARQAWRAWQGALIGGVMGKVGAILMTVFALPFFGGEAVGLWQFLNATSIEGAVALALILLLNIVFYHLLKAPTLLGRRAMDQISGFAEYLAVAEQHRMNLLNPPDRTPELFEKYLPYALALGLEHAWSEQFAGVLARAGTPDGTGRRHYRPSWYSGRRFTGESFGDLAGSLSTGFATAVASSSTAPGSSSGSGGGGSSGGGGGGGGGGGW